MCVCLSVHQEVWWRRMGRELQRLMVNQPNQSQAFTHHTYPHPPPSRCVYPSIHPSHHPPPHPSPPRCGHIPAAHPSVPAVVLDHVGQLDDELALFILLTALKGMFLRGVAAERRKTAFTSSDRWIEKNNMFISLTGSIMWGSSFASKSP